MMFYRTAAQVAAIYDPSTTPAQVVAQHPFPTALWLIIAGGLILVCIGIALTTPRRRRMEDLEYQDLQHRIDAARPMPHHPSTARSEARPTEGDAR